MTDTKPTPAGERVLKWLAGNEKRNLRRKAKPLPVSQVELADALGCSKQQLSQWIVGYRTPTGTRGLKIEQLTGIPMSAWWETDDEE